MLDLLDPKNECLCAQNQVSTSHNMAAKKVSQLKKYSLAAGERSQAVKVEAICFWVKEWVWRIESRLDDLAGGGCKRPGTWSRTLSPAPPAITSHSTSTAALFAVLDCPRRARFLSSCESGRLPTLNVLPSRVFSSIQIRYPSVQQR